METLVVGHKNPDMDAICSAIGYAAYKRAVGEENVVAARCGDTNERIDYVLNKFSVEAPRFLSTVAPKVQDVMQSQVITAKASDPAHYAMHLIAENQFRGLPVTREDGKFLGLLSGFKLCGYFFPSDMESGRHREVITSLNNLTRSIEGTVLHGEPDQAEEPYILIVAAMYNKTFEGRLGGLDANRVVLFVGDRYDIQELAIQTGVAALVLTGGLGVPEKTLELAREHGTLLVSAPFDTASTVLLARGSVPAERLVREKTISCSPTDPLAEVQRKIVNSNDFVFPVLDEENCLIGVLSKSDLLRPVNRQLILVDHNELNQAVDGASKIPIVEIIDHHRLDAPPTDTPIFFLNQPVGSTCTIVAERYRLAGLDIPKDIAGCLMAGLLSDTLNLTSPTATAIDRDVMSRLEQITGIQPTKLAEEIFSIGSPLLTMKPDQAIDADCKEYTENGIRFSLAQIEELSFSHFSEKKKALSNALEQFRTARGLAFSALLVTDVMSRNSILILRGDRRVADQINYPRKGSHAWQLDGVVSRKKQLLPFIIRCLNNIT